jgi:ATP-dependent exoDNAse (exonuclease V) beta subunit
MKQNLKSVEIISASAGSGKTYTLVFHFLKTLLSKPTADTYRKMIALTFTNKAVFEMKSRILKSLKEYSSLVETGKTPQMVLDLCEALELSTAELAFRSRQALKLILQDYAAFEVVTLDRFTHRIIRSFARDLGLSLSFEVEIQQEQMLSQVVERIIDKAGSDKEITPLLEQFTLQKMDDQLSWDISANLFEIAKLLLKENDRIPLQYVLSQSRTAFGRQHNFLKTYSNTCKQNISLLGTEVLGLIESKQLTQADFSRGTLYKHFQKLKQLDFVRLYENKLEENLEEEKNIYNKSLDSGKASRIDEILPDLRSSFHKAKQYYHQFSLANDISKQWIPLSLIKILDEELELYQRENNKVLLGTFNDRISKEILHQPAPYIYERLGEHYRHYYLDEFQDTSSLQWSNLIPLISQPLEGLDEDGTSGSLLIVGDPKQSIYRWRGGHVEQFLSLLQSKSPFQVSSNISSLETNYRSYDVVVNFNNAFFESLLPQIHGEQNRLIFSDNCKQNTNSRAGGYVEIDQFFAKDTKEEVTKIHVQKSFEAINSALEQDFAHNEIAVLVRTKAQATAISESLAIHGIPFLSSESLNLSHSKEVLFLIGLLRLVLDENNLEHRLTVLEFLRSDFGGKETYHDFISTRYRKPIQTILNAFEIEFNFSNFKAMPLYEAVEAAFYAFELSNSIDAHLQTFLDHVFEFSQQKHNDILSFIMHWELQGDSLYVATPKGVNAIQVLTIHKAKGLEFPVVILPFLDDPIQGNHQAKVWLETEEFFGETISKGWIPFTKRVETYGEQGKALFDKVQRANELDALDVLYVAMTRPVEQLIMISNGAAAKQDSYPSFIQNFLNINGKEEEAVLTLGEKRSVVINQDFRTEQGVFSIEAKAKDWQKNLMLQAYSQPESKQNSPKVQGILIHELLAKIEIATDIDWVLEEACALGKIDLNTTETFKQMLTDLVDHPVLKPFFRDVYTVWNERDILIPDSENIRPDRLMENKHEMVLIDYKTGKPKNEDRQQIEHYKNIISQVFKYKKVKTYLVYIQAGKKIAIG